MRPFWLCRVSLRDRTSITNAGHIGQNPLIGGTPPIASNCSLLIQERSGFRMGSPPRGSTTLKLESAPNARLPTLFAQIPSARISSVVIQKLGPPDPMFITSSP